MSIISLGLSGMAPDPAGMSPSLILTGLRNGQAQPGDTLQAILSDGTPIQSYAWGSSPGSSDFGTGATLVVSEAAAGGVLYVTVQAQATTFSTTAPVAQISGGTTAVVTGPSRIDIEDLAPLPARPGLALSAGPSLITVENV